MIFHCCSIRCTTVGEFTRHLITEVLSLQRLEVFINGPRGQFAHLLHFVASFREVCDGTSIQQHFDPPVQGLANKFDPVDPTGAPTAQSQY